MQRHSPHSRLLAEQAADQIATSYAHGPLAESMAQAPRATSVRVGRRLWLELATRLRNSGLQRSVEWHLRDELFKVAAERLDGVSGIAEVESQLCIPGIGGERDTISGLGIYEATGGLAIRRPSVAIGLAQVELRSRSGRDQLHSGRAQVEIGLAQVELRSRSVSLRSSSGRDRPRSGRAPLLCVRFDGGDAPSLLTRLSLLAHGGAEDAALRSGLG